MEQTTKPYDVTIAKIGTLRVTATSRDEAMQLRSSILLTPDYAYRFHQERMLRIQGNGVRPALFRQDSLWFPCFG